MNKLQEKFQFLLDKYSVDTKAVIKNSEAVIIDSKEYPIFAHRSERRFIELKNIANNGTLEGISVMRVARIAEKGTDIYKALYREFDLCQWILEDKLISVAVMENDNVMNVIAAMQSGIVCTIEISATLRQGEKPIDKHEIIARCGTACDVVVDAQLRQASIYVFGEENKKFTDVDFELYGLSAEEITIVRGAFGVAQKKNYEELLQQNAEIMKLVSMAKASSQNGERVIMK